ncbi:Sodium/calcium exchanger protein-domain-containing protein [Radiomyces spectabilis]|uniref:Sodium/calcium exchanger protein-domain-containing protein n=1 Tax=Radiomyces spectabilis TaxID=64574 RepID=UPI00221FC79E|nr:Sodium/calcium exchanger protein-domain-containing protein [Radiomyces spectabilis]KAI8376246.1 Sodium/calcium exchanger protein-domain-containing protein [Radiomyces spectabilis]
MLRLLVIALIVVLLVFSVLGTTLQPQQSITTNAFINLFTSRHHKTCANIEQHQDQCAFVKSACRGFSGVYLRFYYCSELWRPISATLLCSGLLVLFGAVSVVASDFFCPNLQTISSKLQLSESMAGVTILAFGNGSPDLFSTFSAMNTGAGSMAIGELIGAAFFIVSVVSGCMGIIRPFKSKRITFMRDASFLTGAIMLLTWIVYHQRIYWYHGVALILYYLAYVFAVVFGAYRSADTEIHPQLEPKSVASMHSTNEDLVSETSRLLASQGKQGPKPPRLAIPDHGFLNDPCSFNSEQHMGHIIRPVSLKSASYRSSLHLDSMLNLPRTTSTNGSISSRLYRSPISPRVGIRASLFSAIEFQEQVTAIRRNNSSSHMIDAGTRNDTSLPPHTWYRTSQNSVCGMWSARPKNRPRSSTVADSLLPIVAGNHRRATTPDSTHSSTGVAEDYFTYISTNQRSRPADIHHRPVVSDHNDIAIPEIRLAPPGIDHTPSSAAPASSSQDPVSECSTSISELPKDAAPHSSSSGLAAPVSPHSSHSLESSHALSARQSPYASPHPTTYDQPPCLPLPASHHEPINIKIQYNDDRDHDDNNEDEEDVLDAAKLLHDKSKDDAWVAFRITLDSIWQTLLPTLQGWSHKSTFARLSSIVAMPLVFIFTLTLPVAEADVLKVDAMEVIHDDFVPETSAAMDMSSKGYLSVPGSDPGADYREDNGSEFVIEEEIAELSQPWCRWLLATQAMCATIFVFIVMTVNGYISALCILYGVVIGAIGAVVVLKKTQADEPPEWYWMLSFGGFVVALIWIFLLANEMVGLLQALGTIFNISDAIMGLTIFAVGNSVGDLVSNTAIAKMGFPTMAISACYAGPLLNMVLGVGISSTYQTWLTGKPYELEIAPTILISSTGLIVVLLSTLIVVNMNGYHITEGLGWWMIIIYSSCCFINVLLEFHVLK